MDATEELWEELDADFIEQVDILVQQATASTQRRPPKPSAASSPPPPPSFSGATFHDVSHSPPRELSQRFLPAAAAATTNTTTNTNTHSAISTLEPHHFKIDFLKSELSRVSKQLSDLKEECSQLKRERDKKQQPKTVYSKTENGTWSSGAVAQDHPMSGMAQKFVNASAGLAASRIGVEQRSIGIQTDRGDVTASISTNDATTTCSDRHKLLAVWSLGSGHRSRRNFMAKLLETCASDFCYLFGFLGSNVTSKTGGELPGNVQGPHSAEASRISYLYSLLTKLSSNMVDLDALIEGLLDLCNLENALVVHRSLHILHVALDHSLSMDRTRPRRDNVKVEICNADCVRIHDPEEGISGEMYDIIRDETSRGVTALENVGTAKHETTTKPCHVDWFDLFESLRQIAARLTDGHAKMKAVSIMNVILMTTDAYSERGKFCGSLVFETLAILLRKDAGLLVQKEAVRLLFLLLNSPNILTMFCTSCKGGESHMQSSNDTAKNLTVQVSSGILEGLADCVGCSRCGEKELNLRRSATMVLAFLAASGKPGLEVFLFYKLSRGANFLELILQVLVSEIDADALDSWSAPEISKERTLLIREALILLNRLASHPTYSTTVWQVLTSCRDTISLAIDVATRLSKKSRRILKADSITRQMRESEVVDLARVFRKRVLTFLG